MRVLVSACLSGENCKYSGGNNFSHKVQEYLEKHTVIPVCPEVLGGLPVPRTPAEIVDGVVINRDGINVDKEFREGAQKALEIALREEVDLAILQSRSPSCGAKEIYDGSFSKKIFAGQGIFAKMLTDAGIKIIDAEDL